MPKGLSGLKRLQRAPDEVKKKWMIGATAISMILVITFWIFYLNTTMPAINTGTKPETDEVKQNNNASVQSKNFESFGGTFKKGLLVISENFKNKIDEFKNQVGRDFDSLKSRIQKKNEIFIESDASPEFQPPYAEEIQPTELP